MFESSTSALYGAPTTGATDPSPRSKRREAVVSFANPSRPDCGRPRGVNRSIGVRAVTDQLSGRANPTAASAPTSDRAVLADVGRAAVSTSTKGGRMIGRFAALYVAPGASAETLLVATMASLSSEQIEAWLRSLTFEEWVAVANAYGYDLEPIDDEGVSA